MAYQISNTFVTFIIYTCVTLAYTLVGLLRGQLFLWREKFCF